MESSSAAHSNEDIDLRQFELALADPAFTTVVADAGGPPLWHTIHNLARAYKPETQRELMATWLKTTSALMWCETCAQHFGKMVQTADLSSAAAFLAWTVRTHNAVNARLGKPILSDAAAIDAIRAAGRAVKSAQTSTPERPDTRVRPNILNTLHCQSPLGWQITTVVLTCITLVLICICIWIGLKLRKK
jgi:hypothetical protein